MNGEPTRRRPISLAELAGVPPPKRASLAVDTGRWLREVTACAQLPAELLSALVQAYVVTVLREPQARPRRAAVPSSGTSETSWKTPSLRASRRPGLQFLGNRFCPRRYLADLSGAGCMTDRLNRQPLIAVQEPSNHTGYPRP